MPILRVVYHRKPGTCKQNLTKLASAVPDISLGSQN